jgi:hypothetical protein
MPTYFDFYSLSERGQSALTTQVWLAPAYGWLQFGNTSGRKNAFW